MLSDFNDKFCAYTDKVMLEMMTEFKRRYPNHTLEFKFGMGGHTMSLNGEYCGWMDCNSEYIDERIYKHVGFVKETMDMLDLHHENGIDANDISTDDIKLVNG